MLSLQKKWDELEVNTLNIHAKLHILSHALKSMEDEDLETCILSQYVDEIVEDLISARNVF